MSITVGQIGLGVLGSAMAPNIMKSGFALIGYDVRAIAVEELAALGMILGDNAGDVAMRADMVITCLPSAASLMEVAGAIAAAAKPSQIVIETSTLAVASVIELSNESRHQWHLPQSSSHHSLSGLESPLQAPSTHLHQ